MCFGQPDLTYRSRPTRDFFYENAVFFVGGLYNWGFNSLKKTEPTLHKVFKTVARNTHFLFGLILVHQIYLSRELILSLKYRKKMNCAKITNICLIKHLFYITFTSFGGKCAQSRKFYETPFKLRGSHYFLSMEVHFLSQFSCSFTYLKKNQNIFFQYVDFIVWETFVNYNYFRKIFSGNTCCDLVPLKVSV